MSASCKHRVILSASEESRCAVYQRQHDEIFVPQEDTTPGRPSKTVVDESFAVVYAATVARARRI